MNYLVVSSSGPHLAFRLFQLVFFGFFWSRIFRFFSDFQGGLVNDLVVSTSGLIWLSWQCPTTLLFAYSIPGNLHLNLCFCVFVFVYLYFCVFVYFYICICVFVFVYLYFCVFVYLYLCIFWKCSHHLTLCSLNTWQPQSNFVFLCIFWCIWLSRQPPAQVVYLHICVFVYLYICVFLAAPHHLALCLLDTWQQDTLLNLNLPIF